MLHRYSKVTIILKMEKNVKETIILRKREYMFDFHESQIKSKKSTP